MEADDLYALQPNGSVPETAGAIPAWVRRSLRAGANRRSELMQVRRPISVPVANLPSTAIGNGRSMDAVGACLEPVELRIEAVGGDELVVGAVFGDGAVV